MSALCNTVVHFVDEQLRYIFAAPSMWGGDEAIELQVVQLLEFRSVALRPELEKRAPRTILDAYHRILKEEFPGAPPYPLFALLEKFERKGELIPLLRRFAERIVREMEPEDVFAAHDLVLRLWFREEVRGPRASALSSYYDVLRRVLRALSRSRGSRGPAGRELEEALDFAISDVDVVPPNGVSAHMVLPLDQIEPRETENVKRALAQIVAVNEWAADPSRPVSALEEDLHDRATSQHVAAQALRLMPNREAAVQTVEVGGRLVDRRTPLTIQPHYAGRIVGVVKQSEALREFDVVGSIRAVDIDQRSMRILVGKQSIRCWMEDPKLLDVARDALGHRARIIGRQYKDPGSPLVVIVGDMRR
jgi:hypothetical protein